MGIGGLSRGFDPRGEVTDILVVGEEREFRGSGCLEPKQESAGLGNIESVLRGLRHNSNETKFGDGARCQLRSFFGGEKPHPVGDPFVKLVLKEA